MPDPAHPAERTRRSAVVPVSKTDVVTEYEGVAGLRYAHDRAVWGRSSSMTGRWRFGLETLAWEGVHSWLDVGCGEGGFFQMVEAEGHRFEQLYGVDLSPSMIARANALTLASPARFAVADLDDLPGAVAPCDVVSAVGVLQKCGVTLARFAEVMAALLRPGGTLYMTTKNRAWAGFEDVYARPEIGHSWFHPDDLREAFSREGLTVTHLSGLLPDEVRAVELDASQTLALVARRTG